jgi:hypothetical protein
LIRSLPQPLFIIDRRPRSPVFSFCARHGISFSARLHQRHLESSYALSHLLAIFSLTFT